MQHVDTTVKNDTLLRAAQGQETDWTPVWMMRQAGRYLPEYREIRKGKTFFETCQDPDLVTEITLQPLRRFDLDAAIIFSDILVIPQAMGMQVEMIPGRGPVLPAPLSGAADVAALEDSDLEDRLWYVFEGIKRTRAALEGRVPLIGFAGAPWTLMAYMIEGGGSRTFEKARAWLHAEPELSQRLLDRITTVLVRYLDLQIQAGAQFIQVFDSWAGLLGPELFGKLCLPHLRRIARELGRRHPHVPRAVFARGVHHSLPQLGRAGYDVVSLDWTIDPLTAREVIGPEVTLQGNLDPAALFSKPRDIRDAVSTMLDGFRHHRHIANLGHGMMPSHTPESAAAFVDSVHELSARSV